MRSPWTCWLDAASLVVQSQSVIAMRLMRIASGGAAATSEIHRMIFEKVAASAEAQVAAALALLAGGGIHKARGAAGKLYKRALRANHRRLARRR